MTQLVPPNISKDLTEYVLVTELVGQLLQNENSPECARKVVRCFERHLPEEVREKYNPLIEVLTDRINDYEAGK